MRCAPAPAALLHALLKATDKRLAGCFPNANPGLAAGTRPVADNLFIVGDFLVIDVDRTSLRFDERLMLKEDYDYTAQHLHEHGGVCGQQFTLRGKSGQADDTACVTTAH